jgi:DNA helicase-2/ATP-dependent DNA helicase PcrA
MEEGLFPHSRSMEDQEQMEEERRLCYVGVTRAKERLYLLRTFRRTLYGESNISEPSRFLHDIPAQLVGDRPGRGRAHRAPRKAGAGRFLGGGGGGAGRASASLRESGEPARRPARAQERPAAGVRRFQTGDQVEHEVFGRGVVIESQPQGGDEQVTVAFASEGLKRLMASMAPMEKVDED